MLFLLRHSSVALFNGVPRMGFDFIANGRKLLDSYRMVETSQCKW